MVRSLSSYALGDLVKIWQYIQRDDPEAADRVETELLDKCESPARMPGQGHRRTGYTKAAILFFPVYSYLIAFHCAWRVRGQENPETQRGLSHESGYLEQWNEQSG